VDRGRDGTRSDSHQPHGRNSPRQAVWIGRLQILSAVFPGRRAPWPLSPRTDRRHVAEAALEFSFFPLMPTMAAHNCTTFSNSCRRGGVGAMNRHEWTNLAIGSWSLSLSPGVWWRGSCTGCGVTLRSVRGLPKHHRRIAVWSGCRGLYTGETTALKISRKLQLFCHNYGALVCFRARMAQLGRSAATTQWKSSS